MTNIETVEKIYGAEGMGEPGPDGVLQRDHEAMIAMLSPDFVYEGDWADNFAQRAGVYYLMEFRGHEGMRELFAVTEDLQIERMEIKSIFGSGNKVCAEILFEAKNPEICDEECHVWTFDDDGVPLSLRHYLDTAKHIDASQGQA
jgi:uncharacterized protein